MLAEIGGKVAVQRQYRQRDIFLHHADNAVLDHPHQCDMRRQAGRIELVDTGAYGKDDLQAVSYTHLRAHET